MVLVVDTRVPQTPHALSDEGYRTGSPQKSSPFKDFSLRYPPPDPKDPFAPLSALRNRRTTLQGILSPDSLRVDDIVQRTADQTKHASIDIAPFIPTAKKLARPVLKSQLYITESSQKDTLAVPQATFERRRSISTPTPVSSLVLSSATRKRQPDVLVERPRPFTVSDVRLATIHDPDRKCADASESLSSSSTLEDTSFKAPRHYSSNPQLPLLVKESPTNKRINFPKFALSKKSQHNPVSLSVDAANERAIAPAPALIPLTAVPSLLEYKSTSPEPPTNTTSSTANDRSRYRRATTETPSLISSKSLSTSSSDSSTVVFNVIVPSPSPDITSVMYQQGTKSLSNPRLSTKVLQGPVPPAASYASQPSTSSGNPTRSRLSGSSTVSDGTTALPFDVSTPPTLEQLSRAAALDVIAESGVRVPFGRLFMGQRTIICFIRHFW